MKLFCNACRKDVDDIVPMEWVNPGIEIPVCIKCAEEMLNLSGGVINGKSVFEEEDGTNI